MSSDRTHYDEGAIRTAIRQSTAPLTWILDLNAHENTSLCGTTPNVSNHADRTDVESQLRSLDKPLTNDPSKKYQKGEQTNKLDYSPPYLCERAINHPNFELNIPFRNDYQEKVRTANPNELGLKSEALEKVQKFVNSLDN